MGVKLTVSVANELDLWEREPGRAPGGAVLLDKPAVTPLGQLMFLEKLKDVKKKKPLKQL